MRLALCAAAALTLSGIAPVSQAVELRSSVTALGGSSWKVDLTLVNDDASLVTAANPAGTISEFTVFFPYGSFSALSSLSAPAAWDPLAIQPDASPSDGYVDYLINTGFAPLAIGASATGFSIGFSYAGTGQPGPFAYAIVDPDTFATLKSGTTVAAVSAVPEPTTGALLTLGLGALAWRGRSSLARQLDTVEAA